MKHTPYAFITGMNHLWRDNKHDTVNWLLSSFAIRANEFKVEPYYSNPLYTARKLSLFVNAMLCKTLAVTSEQKRDDGFKKAFSDTTRLLMAISPTCLLWEHFKYRSFSELPPAMDDVMRRVNHYTAGLYAFGTDHPPLLDEPTPLKRLTVYLELLNRSIFKMGSEVRHHNAWDLLVELVCNTTSYLSYQHQYEKYLVPSADRSAMPLDSITQVQLLKEVLNPVSPFLKAKDATYLDDPQVLSLAKVAHDNPNMDLTSKKYGTLDQLNVLAIADALEEANCPTTAKCATCNDEAVTRNCTRFMYSCGELNTPCDCNSWSSCADCKDIFLSPSRLISHLREDRDHYQGCWVIDLLLKKDGVVNR